MVFKALEELGDRLLTRAEVAEIFQVSPSTVTRWAEAGLLPSVKTLGGHHRYEAKAVLELAQRLSQKGVSMENAVFELPLMYADHHVLEVRRILQQLPGVKDIYASSCFHTVEVTFDPAQITREEIAAKLSEAGYDGDVPAPIERGIAVTEDNPQPFFRHTAAFEQARNVVTFTQSVNYSGRPLWPCPGMGVVRTSVEVEEE